MNKKLEIGNDHDFEVRREMYNSDLDINITVLFLSDLHFNGFSQPVASRLIATINELNPTIILLGGDYADTNAGLKQLEYLLNTIALRKNVFAIAGNHDQFFGIEKIRQLMIANGVSWIDKQSASLKVDKVTISIHTQADKSIIAKEELALLLLHKPVDIQTFAHQYHLAFAGHLHGCQCILWQNKKGLYLGRLFYKWNRLKAQSGKCTYLISKGLGDTLPVRYNCKRDIIFVTIGQ